MFSKWVFLGVSGLGAALLTALVMHLSLFSWRRSVGAHWTERARLLWQARRTLTAATCASLAVAVLAWIGFFPEEDGRWWLLGTILGVILGSYPSAQEIEPRYTFPVWLEQTAWTIVVQFSVLGIFLWLLFTMPEELRAVDWLRAAGGLLLVVAIQTGIWIPLVAKLFPKHHTEEARLDRLVAQATAITGIKSRHTWLAITPVANAAALPHVRGLVVTTRLMEILSDDELHAILMHEMAHLRESLAVQLARLAGSLCWMAAIFLPPVSHSFGILGVLLLLGGIVLAMRLSRALAHRLEHHADTAAIEAVVDPATYAGALEKLYQANQVPAVMRGRMVHPHLYDRMLKAGATPAYPRPAAPGPMAWPGWAVLLLPLALIMWAIVERVGKS